MESDPYYVVTPVVVSLREFLARPGVRHTFLIGPGGAGKTAALRYLAAVLRAENHLVVVIQLRELDTGDQLLVSIGRALLQEAAEQGNSAVLAALDQMREQFNEHFTASQRLSTAAEVLERIIQLAIDRGDLERRAYIFLDGLDEASRAGDIALAVEELAERLRSTSLVVASREAPVVSRLSLRSNFDTFRLRSLTQAESRNLLDRLLPHRSISGSLQAMISRAGGNPLMLRLLAAYFNEHGNTEIEQHISLEYLIDRVYQRLLGPDQAGTDAALLLTLLAFFQPVSLSDLEKLSGLPADRTLAASNILSNSTLVISSATQWAFAHPLIAETHLQSRLVQHDIDISEFRFGDEAAERDGLLKQSFMPPRDLHLVATGAKTIVLGDRGAGKSAIFRALQESTGDIANPTDAGEQKTIISACQSPAAFVQQMTADDSHTSSADGFKAVWLLYSAALAARDIDVDGHSDCKASRAFIRDARKLLRRIGWDGSIRHESHLSKWWAALRSFLPDKVTFKVGPVTVEPNLNKRWHGWPGGDMRIDDFIDRADLLLQATNRRQLIVFDQIDEVFKYQQDRQEALVQGLFLAESFLSLRSTLRLIVLLRTDLFELYDIQEKNKFVSRTVRLGWSRNDLRKLLLHRLFSNDELQEIVRLLNAPLLAPDTLALIKLRIVFPAEVEGKRFEDWLFDGLKNGKDHIAPRQIIMFLNMAREQAKDEATRRRIPLFSENEVADAMTRVSELSYEEVVSDFRAATGFVRNCRAGKIREFEPEKVNTLFDEKEGSPVLQLERLERLGFLSRTIFKDGDSLVPRFRIPRLFTRCWETST